MSTFIMFAIFAFLIVWIPRTKDKKEITNAIEKDKGEIVSIVWNAKGKKWYTNEGSRTYDVTYKDKFKNLRKTSVYHDPFIKNNFSPYHYTFEDDTILEVSKESEFHQASIEQKNLVLEQENLKLKQEIERLKGKSTQ